MINSKYKQELESKLTDLEIIIFNCRIVDRLTYDYYFLHCVNDKLIFCNNDYIKCRKIANKIINFVNYISTSDSDVKVELSWAQEKLEIVKVNLEKILNLGLFADQDIKYITTKHKKVITLLEILIHSINLFLCYKGNRFLDECFRDTKKLISS